MTTDTCHVCRSQVETRDGLPIEHRHRDWLGACPGGVVPAEQCCGPVYNGSLSAPERCAYPTGHEGKCEA